MGIRVIGAAAAVVALAVPATASAVQPTKADQKNAAQECRYERGNAHATQLAFLHWGTNANHRNAFGKCVSATAREEAQEREDAHANAAKDCKAEQDMTDQEFMALHETVETFEQFYGGTNDSLSNAYGKCVSVKAKANKEEMDEEDHEHAEQIKQAAKTCMAARRANLRLFRNTYGTNWNKRNAFERSSRRTSSSSPGHYARPTRRVTKAKGSLGEPLVLPGLVRGWIGHFEGRLPLRPLTDRHGR